MAKMAFNSAWIFVVLTMVTSRAGAYNTWWMDQPYEDNDEYYDDFSVRAKYNDDVTLV